MTKEQLAKITPVFKYEELKPLLDKYQINTPFREAMFLAQCAVESGNFKTKMENLNYSEQSLLKVFPGYFANGKRDVKAYARQPEKIANLVYNDANRSPKAQLGNKEPGDGWKYRGRGYIQLTGKANYQAFAKAIGKTLEEVIPYLETDTGALHSALYYWDSRKLNSFCNEADVEGSVVTVTKKINGGTHGLDMRRNNFKKYFDILKG